MKRLLVVVAVLAAMLPVSVSAAPNDPTCQVSTTLGGLTFGPEFLFVLVTGLREQSDYLLTLTKPDGADLSYDLDYGQTHVEQAFNVGTPQSGTYTATVDLVHPNGKTKDLATTCSLLVVAP